MRHDWRMPNEDERVMREQLRDRKFKDIETLLDGLFEDVNNDLDEEDVVMFESIRVVYLKISEVQRKIKKENMESLTQDEIQVLKESEEKLKSYLKLLQNSKRANDATKDKLFEVEKLLKQKTMILSNKA